jgi:hypothetical protein
MGRLRTKQWCNHYRGMHEKQACEAGVRFDSLPHYGTEAFMGACPCFGPCGGCDKAEYPTLEQLEENRKALNKRLEGIGKARSAIVESLGGPWKRGMPGASGAIDCPVCSGQKSLRFSRSGYNGHIHAACTTEDCIRWME